MNLAALLRRSVAFCLALALASCATPRALEQDEHMSLDPVMGDWEGHRVTSSGVVVPLCAQVIALGDGAYRAVLLDEFGKPSKALAPLDFRLEGEVLVFSGVPAMNARLSDGWIDGSFPGDEAVSFKLRRISRLSPTLGAKAPPGATVLFDGTSLDGWARVEGPGGPAGWNLVEGEAMEVVGGSGSIMTKKTFKDVHLHLEFRTPFMPASRGQARGNSGVYLQGRYEVQVLDSYGLTGEDNECGGIYKVARPLVNMCAPPGQWQTYDITFQAPRFDASGSKIRQARATVLHNGVPIHQYITLPGPTGGALDTNEQMPGPLYLQDHGNPVQYRNIWLTETTQ